MRLKYRSPMKYRYLDVGKIDGDGWEIATMLTIEELASCNLATFKHGSDGGGLQLEIDEIGEKLVRAFNAYDDLLAACEFLVAEHAKVIVSRYEGQSDKCYCSLCDEARAAIAKAKGESQ